MRSWLLSRPITYSRTNVRLSQVHFVVLTPTCTSLLLEFMMTIVDKRQLTASTIPSSTIWKVIARDRSALVLCSFPLVICSHFTLLWFACLIILLFPGLYCRVRIRANSIFPHVLKKIIWRYRRWIHLYRHQALACQVSIMFVPLGDMFTLHTAMIC
jgi:hypothetical protein